MITGLVNIGVSCLTPHTVNSLATGELSDTLLAIDLGNNIICLLFHSAMLIWLLDFLLLEGVVIAIVIILFIGIENSRTRRRATFMTFLDTFLVTIIAVPF